MENENSKKLGTLIEVLTHSGSTTVDEDVFKQVKKICKSSQDYIPVAYDYVLKQLKKKNSQIRFLTFQICKELFTRSGLFRELVIRDLQVIFGLTAEINTNQKLPPPKSSAESLKALAISTLKKWVEEYGETHKKLKVAYNYLQKCKKVDFETLEVGNSAERVVEDEQQRHFRVVNNEKIKKLMEEFNSNESEIQNTITSLSSCLSLLLPPLEDFFIPENNLPETTVTETTISENHQECDEEIDESDFLASKTDLREFGVSANYILPIQLFPNEKIKIVATEENISVIENAKDCVRLICNRFLPMVKKWIKIYCKCSDRENNNDIKKFIDLKEKLENVYKKYESLNIEGGQDIGRNESSDDDFEEVKKEGYEDTVDFSEEDLIAAYGGVENKKNLKPVTTKQSDSSSICDHSSKVSEEQDLNAPSTSGTQYLDRKKKLMAVAPKLPFDIDLYHWEDEHLATPTLVSTKIDVDKFWGSCGSDDIHEIPNPEGLAALRTRVIEFSGKFEPVKWACRAPLSNGKLCLRKDRFKCPFHGKIIPRDETGKCINPEDEKIAKQTAGECSNSEWQDPELLKDLKAATGVDLKMPEKKGKRKKSERTNLTHKKMKTSSAALKILENKKLPGLVDVVRKQNNSHTRLSKKIFNRSSLKRVSSVLNKIDRNKFRDKFGDQFNYS